MTKKAPSESKMGSFCIFYKKRVARMGKVMYIYNILFININFGAHEQYKGAIQ